MKNLWRWFLGPAVAILIWSLPFDLGFEAHALAGIAAWVVLWWIAEPIPLAMTGLLGATLNSVLGVAPIKEILSPYAHPLVFLFMGGFFLARAMSIHGLDRRVALFLLTRPSIAGHPWRIILALWAVTAFLSMWISNTATTAMMLPIALGILHAVLPKDPKAQGLILISMAHAASIGGVATPIGSTPNIVALGFLGESLQVDLSFFEWMSFGLPTVMILLGFLAIFTRLRLPELKQSSSQNRKMQSLVVAEQKKLGSMSRGEKNTLLACLVAVTLWTIPSLFKLILGADHPIAITLKTHFPEATVAILAATLLFILPCRKDRGTLTWNQAKEIDWSSLLLFGSGLSLGSLMFQTGLATVLGKALILATGSGSSFWLFTAGVVFFSIFFTETTSNTASANMLIPLVIGASQTSGFDPLIPTLGVAMACSLAFMMPVSTPPNAIVYGSGLVEMRQMLRAGWKMNFSAGGVILVILKGITFFTKGT